MQEISKQINEGIQLYDDGDYEKALGQFDSVLSISPNNSETLLFKGKTLGALGQFEDALDCFDKVLDRDSENISANKAKEIFSNMAQHTIKTIAPKESQGAKGPRMPSPCNQDIKRIEAKFELKEREILFNGAVGGSQDKINKEKSSENLYDFLKSSEIENFMRLKKVDSTKIKNIFSNLTKNSYDDEKIKELIGEGNFTNLMDFLKKVKLRNSFLDYLADSNILAPRKYNTITTQIQSINAEFGLAYLMFNLGELMYRDILSKIDGGAIIIENLNGTENSNNGNDNKPITERLSIIKEVLKFFIRLFSFEKSFSSEKNKLQFFRYLFTFLGFLALLMIVGYGIKNAQIKADIKSTTTKEMIDGKENAKYERNLNMNISQ